MHDLANDVANVLYNTTLHSEHSVAALRQDTGVTLSMVEATIGQVGSSVQSLGSHVEQISAEQ